MNILFIIKVKILKRVKWSYRSPCMLIMEPRIFEFFEHVVQSIVARVFVLVVFLDQIYVSRLLLCWN